MKLRVDEGLCIGCGACVASFPELFVMNDDGLSECIGNGECGDSEGVDAIEVCPVGAIEEADS